MKRLLALLLCTFPIAAAELELRYTALEHILADQLFTQEGRHYVRGNRTTKCQFAYLETPHIDSDAGRLRIAARFSGRSALDLFGGCVGLGDSFDLTITAVPIPRNNTIALSEVKVTAVKDSYYIRRVRSAMATSIAHDFKIELRDQAPPSGADPRRRTLSPGARRLHSERNQNHARLPHTGPGLPTRRKVEEPRA